MFIGHALLAFALVGFAAHRLGWSPERALTAGVAAALFATLPDVDMLYAPVGLLEATTLSGAPTAFFETGNLVHRALTHSLLVGVVAASAFACWHVGGRRSRALAVATLLGFVTVAFVVSGPLGAFIATAFGAAGLALTAGIARRTALSARALWTVAAVGMVSHPFGDLFTGAPPAFLYPLEVPVVAERVVLHADPTVGLLAAFWVELGVVWLAALVYLDLRGLRLRDGVDWRATLGVAYAGAVLAIPAPSIDAAGPFVVSVLAVGFVGTMPRLRARPTLPDRTTAVLTGLTAVTLASAAYLGAYLLV